MKCPICEKKQTTKDPLGFPVSVIRFGTAWDPSLVSDLQIDDHQHGLTGRVLHFCCTNYHTFKVPEKIKCDVCNRDYPYEGETWALIDSEPGKP